MVECNKTSFLDTHIFAMSVQCGSVNSLSIGMKFPQVFIFLIGHFANLFAKPKSEACFVTVVAMNLMGSHNLAC